MIYFGVVILSVLVSYVFNDVMLGGVLGVIYGFVGVLLVFGYKY